jgi:hypothetical protein
MGKMCKYVNGVEIAGSVPHKGPSRYDCQNAACPIYGKTCIANFDHNDFRSVGGEQRLVRLVEFAAWKASDCSHSELAEVAHAKS